MDDDQQGKTVTVTGPDGKSYQFPADVTDAEITAFFRPNFIRPEQPPPAAPDAPALKRLAGGFWQVVNPLSTIAALAQPWKTVPALVNAQIGEFKKAGERAGAAREAFGSGGQGSTKVGLLNAVEAFGHGVAGMVPILGPALAGASEDVADDPAKGTGELLGMAAGGALSKPLARGVASTSRSTGNWLWRKASSGTGDKAVADTVLRLKVGPLTPEKNLQLERMVASTPGSKSITRETSIPVIDAEGRTTGSRPLLDENGRAAMVRDVVPSPSPLQPALDAHTAGLTRARRPGSILETRVGGPALAGAALGGREGAAIGEFLGSLTRPGPTSRAGQFFFNRGTGMAPEVMSDLYRAALLSQLSQAKR